MIVVSSVDMSPQRKHWMETLQAVFYPALAAVGLPCKYIEAVCSVGLIVFKDPFIDSTLFLSQRHCFSNHLERELHALQVQYNVPDGLRCGRQPRVDLHRGSGAFCQVPPDGALLESRALVQPEGYL